jgi:hypothetical protein
VVYSKSLLSGLGGDVKVLKSTLQNCIYFTEYNGTDKIYAKILLEHIRPEWLAVQSDFTYFIPNIEMLHEWDVQLMSKVDLVLCKNVMTYNLIDAPKLLTKFTSMCGERGVKNYNLIAHMAGTSIMKGTDMVLKYWVANNGFQHLNPDVQLLVTYNQPRPMPYWKKLRPTKCTTFMGRPLKGESYKNIFMVQRLDEKEFAYYSGIIGVRLQPSIAEGYGQVLNEGRCMQTLTITTNAPPFNELIIEPSCLIDYGRSTPSYDIFKEFKNMYQYMYRGNAKAYYISEASFTRIVGNIISMSPAEKDRIALEQYNRYVEDREFYLKSIRTIL